MRLIPLHRASLILTALAALVTGILLATANLYLGELNQDEGWYLYASQRVSDGELPYRDFAFSQGPVFPFVYASVYSVVEKWGVGGGRVFTSTLGFLATILAAALAARLAPKPWKGEAALIAFILLSCNVYHSYFTTVVKTYSLCALLITGGLYLLAFSGGKRGTCVSAASGVMLALASGVRLSSVVILPAAVIYLLMDSSNSRKAAPWMFVLGSGLTLLAVFAPFLVMSGETARFWMLEYHTLRWTDGFMSSLIFKAGFISRFVQAYFVAAGIGMFILVRWWFTGRPQPFIDSPRNVRSFMVLLWGVAGIITIVHISAPFPYDDYQVIIMPVISAALAAGLVSVAARMKLPQDLDENSVNGSGMRGLGGFILGICVLASFSSPLNQGWVVRDRDRIWWKIKDKPDLVQLREAGAWIAGHVPQGNQLLTQDLYLAVEAGRAVPHGLDMGPFSYFPDWSREKAELYGVMNRGMLMELIRTADAPIAVFSGYSLSIRSPEIKELPVGEQKELWQIVNERYELVKTIPYFGHAGTELKILEVKP